MAVRDKGMIDLAFLLCFTLYLIFVLFLLCFSASFDYPLFTKFNVSTRLNITHVTQGYGNKIKHCILGENNDALENCRNEDYPAQSFVKFGLLERFIPLCLYYTFFWVFGCMKTSIERRVKVLFPPILVWILIIYLVGDVFQLAAYIVYGFYVAPLYEATIVDWEPIFIVGFVHIIVCVISEWVYIGYKIRKLIQNQRHGITTGYNKFCCTFFSECFLEDPDNLKVESPNYQRYTFKNGTVQSWIDKFKDCESDLKTDLLKMFTYLYEKPKFVPHGYSGYYAYSGPPLEILDIEEIGNERILRTYSCRRDVIVEHKEGVYRSIVPYETTTRGMAPVETANWIDKLLDKNAFLKQRVNRNVNEFYLFTRVSRDRLDVIKEEGLTTEDFRPGRFGSAVYFGETSRAFYLDDQNRQDAQETVILARVILGHYSVVKSGKTSRSELTANIGSSYDSVVVETRYNRLFVLRNVEQIYPEFAITFREMRTN